MPDNLEETQSTSIPEPNTPEDILDTFDLDFGEPAKPEETESKTEEPKPQEATTPEGQAEPQPANQPPAEGTPTESPAQDPAPNPAQDQTQASPVPSDTELKTLMLQILQNRQALRQGANAEKQSAERKPAEAPEDEDTKVFKPAQTADYTFNIPSKLYNGLYGADVSDEERVACLQAFASGIATSVHNRIMQTFGTWTKNQFEAIPAAIDYLVAKRETQKSSQKSIRDDFYGAFPELNKPALGPIIKSTIQAVARETGAKSWSPEVRNKVGTRVRELLAAFAPQVPQATAPATLTPRAPTPAPAAKPVTDPNSPDAIFDVLNSEY
jgi:hypothetical protein